MFITDENGKESLVEVEVESPFNAVVSGCDIIGRQLSRTSLDDIQPGLSIQMM